jgi:hypothetical protein
MTANSHNIDGHGSDPAANDLEPSPKRVRMERQEQDIVILSVRARKCLTKIDKSLSVQSPAKITSPRASTSALTKSKEISPRAMASNSSEIPECCCVCLSGEHQRNYRQFDIRRRSPGIF